MPLDETHILCDGRAVVVQAGDTIASALLRAGVRSLRRSRRGMPRGVYCGIGICHECLVTVDGVGLVRACVATAQPGLAVRTSP